MSEKIQSEELLTDDEKKRVARLATEEAIEKIKKKPQFLALPRKERRRLIKSFRAELA